MIKIIIAKLIVASFVLGMLSITYISARWALSKSLKRAYPNQAEKLSCKEKANALVWVQSKQVLYYTIAGLSILAYLMPGDIPGWFALLFTAIISAMEAKDYSKTITETNSRLSRFLKSKRGN